MPGPDCSPFTTIVSSTIGDAGAVVETLDSARATVEKDAPTVQRIMNAWICTGIFWKEALRAL